MYHHTVRLSLLNVAEFMFIKIMLSKNTLFWKYDVTFSIIANFGLLIFQLWL